MWNDAALNNIYTCGASTDQYSWHSYAGLADNDDYASNRTTRTERVYDGVGQGMPLLYSVAPTYGSSGSNDGSPATTSGERHSICASAAGCGRRWSGRRARRLRRHEV